mgnify:CR=1 FL=1
MKKKRYPTYKRKYKRKKQPRRKILTAIILCVILAVCNGWMPPRSLKEVKDQSRIFGQVFLTYIEENAQILWEDISESASDAVTGLLKQSQTKTGGQTESVSLDQIPEYSGSPYVEINGNIPSFSDEKSAGPAYEFYSELDSLGRCGYAESKVTPELMPVEERGAIGMVKPTGWHTVKYDCVDGKYLYNRCHLIGFQLTAENANTKNLITGTRYLNVEGMLPFENMVADYIKETGNHVLYQVTPIYEGDNLVVSGVQMEAKSVEDNGEGILFNVYCYNVQPGITIDYATGESQLSNDGGSSAGSTEGNKEAENEQKTESTYVLNTNTKKFHLPSCSSLNQMNESNKGEFTGTRDELIQQGYEPCKRCHP